MKKITILLIVLMLISIRLLSEYSESEKLDDIPITTRINDQIDPVIAYGNKVDEYLVVWEDEYTSSNYNIYCRWVANDGTPLSSEINISLSSLDERHPAVTYNTNEDEYLIVWRTEVSYGNYSIKGQRLTSDGILIGNETNISTDWREKYFPDVTYNSINNEYLVVWDQYDYPLCHIYGQRIDNLGLRLDNQIMISSGTSEQLNPAVAHNTANNLYMIVFEDLQFDIGDSTNINGQLVRNNGVLYDDKIEISTWEYNQVKPHLAFNNLMNEFLVIWEDHHWGWGDARDIYGQRINAGGELIDGNFPVSWEGVNLRENPDVVYSQGADEYLVAWEYEYSANDHDIYCRRIGSDGTLIEDEKKVSSWNNNESRPVLASDNNLSYLVIWEDNRDIIIQGINIYGNLVSLNMLSGYVYEGNIGDESKPLSGVILNLYCSNNIDDLGNLIDSIVTDSNGWFGFVISNTCKFYNILETDPLNYTSVGAVSEDGTIVTNNHIQYEYPLDNKTLSGNKFWDHIEVEPSLADLVISDFGNEDDLIWYQIRNIGNIAAPTEHYTALFVDDELKITDIVDSTLDPGEQLTRYFEYNWECTLPDDNIEVIADYGNDLAESNETNNHRKEEWECPILETNFPPISPIINGPTSVDAGTEYDFTFYFFDPEGDDITYYIDWGDNTTSTGCCTSDTDVLLKHIWREDGTYEIKVQASDNESSSGLGRLNIAVIKTLDPIIIIIAAVVVCATAGAIIAIRHLPKRRPRNMYEAEAAPTPPTVPLVTLKEPEHRFSDFTFYYDDGEELKRRVPNGHTLQVNQEYKLEVAIRIKQQGIPFKGDKPIPIKEPKQKKDVTIMVTAEAEDVNSIEITKNTQTITLPPEGDSIKNAIFPVKPLRKSTSIDDLAEIIIRLYYEFNLLEVSVINAEVVSSYETPDKSQFGLPNPIYYKQKTPKLHLIDFDDIKPRIMHIHVTMKKENLLFYFIFKNEKDKELRFPVTAKISALNLEDVLTRVRNLWADIAMSKTYIEKLEGDKDEFLEYMHELALIGNELWVMLFKRESKSPLFIVGEWLEKHPLKKDGIIQISLEEYTSDFVFPWSLIYDKEVPDKPYELDFNGFWGIRYCIEQRLPEQAKDTDLAIKIKDSMKIEFMLWDQFPNADKQVSLMKNLIKKSKGKLNVSDPPVTEADVFYNLVKDSNPHILYFYTHGYTRHRKSDAGVDFDIRSLKEYYNNFEKGSQISQTLKIIIETLQQEQQRSYRSWIKLTHGMIYLNDLYQKIKKLKSRPLVILNMCESAQMTPALTESFIHFFIDRGARSVIGTECPMTVEFAHPFAEKFLKDLLTGDQVGIALLKARRHFIKIKNPFALSYTLYGYSTISYDPPRF